MPIINTKNKVPIARSNKKITAAAAPSKPKPKSNNKVTVNVAAAVAPTIHKPSINKKVLTNTTAVRVSPPVVKSIKKVGTSVPTVAPNTRSKKSVGKRVLSSRIVSSKAVSSCAKCTTKTPKITGKATSQIKNVGKQNKLSTLPTYTNMQRRIPS